MKSVTARLKKRVTSDGLVEMHDHVPIGKEYKIDADSRGNRTGYNYIKRKSWDRELVWDINGGWLPTELLDIDED
jgi:hypothetical protein